MIHFLFFQCPHCGNIFSREWGFFTHCHCPLYEGSVHVGEHYCHDELLDDEIRDQLKFFFRFTELERAKTECNKLMVETKEHLEAIEFCYLSLKNQNVIDLIDLNVLSPNRKLQQTMDALCGHFEKKINGGNNHY